MSRKAGRPSKADLAERERLKAKAAAHDRFRAEMESKIAQGRVKLIEWDDAVVRTLMGETLPDDCLVAAPPVEQFLYQKLRGVPAEKLEEAYCAALLDLLMSDVPLYHYRDGAEVAPRAVQKTCSVGRPPDCHDHEGHEAHPEGAAPRRGPRIHRLRRHDEAALGRPRIDDGGGRGADCRRARLERPRDAVAHATEGQGAASPKGGEIRGQKAPLF